MRQLAAEIITGQPEETYRSPHMERGNLIEHQARAMYELDQCVEVEQVAFIEHDLIRAGSSPDGLVGDDGLIEIKCPKTTTQISTWLRGDMPPEHKPQVQGQLWISEREWVDFVSFDPRIRGKSNYFCTRVLRDEKYISQLHDAVVQFEDELNQLVQLLV